MSITKELRDWFKDRMFMANGWQEIHAIADRIDAEHESACAEAYGNGVMSVPIALDESQWVQLPKDADGEPIHIGDVMEWVRYEGSDQTIVRKVSGVGDGVFFAWSDEQGRYAQYEAHAYRHHHAPTVEDVLRDMHMELDEVTALYVGEAIDSDERDRDEARIFAKYASKLRLAGEDE